VVLDGHMLHLKLTAGVSGMAHAHSLQVEAVDLDEVAGCQLFKSGPVPPQLRFARFHQSPFFISLSDNCCNHRITESQNHRIVGVGRDLCGSSSPTPLPKQGHLQ